MNHQPARRSDLRTPAPTLEPDDAFVARLGALAAAGGREAAPTPRSSTWQVGLAAAAVALLLVGVAWLSGLRGHGTPQPGPAPVSPASPAQPSPFTGSGTSADRPPGDGPATAGPAAGAPGGLGGTSGGAGGTAYLGLLTSGHAPPTHGRPENAGVPGAAEGTTAAPGTSVTPGKGRPTTSPNANAGDHPNANASLKGPKPGKQASPGQGKGRTPKAEKTDDADTPGSANGGHSSSSQTETAERSSQSGEGGRSTP